MNEQQIEELKQDFIDYKTKAERMIDYQKVSIEVIRNFADVTLKSNWSEAEN